ncbi:MAG: type II secretion system F family protein [Thermoguttaceae bacterium]|jgi:type II secretory pathway component PulF
MSQSPATPPITLDQLIALSDEIAALARTGVPLEAGLEALGQDMPGGLGRLARTLAERTGRGQPLAEVLDELGPQLPKACRAVVQAGLRAGRLPAALESLAAALRRLGDLRRSILLAMLYPMIVVGLAWGLFAFFTARIAPQLLETMQSLGLHAGGLFAMLDWCGRGAWLWGPIGPAVLLVLAVLGYFASRRVAMFGRPAGGRLLGWLPWLGRSLGWSRAATLTDVLVLLVENGVPLDESLRLAAEACGDPDLASAAEEMAAAARRGGIAEPAASSPSAAEPPGPPPRGLAAGLPPLLARLVTAGGPGESLLPLLRHASENYHRRARRQAELAQMLLPILATLGVGGVVMLLYGVALFLPYATMLRALGG